MLVTHVLGDCPKCRGKLQYGNVTVKGFGVLRGCENCSYSITIPLPKIKKKILYLDQFFFSSAFKKHDPRFVKAAGRIREISASQLLVVPFSTIHEDETHQWRGFDGKNKEDLMEFIKSTSRGHQFKLAYDVEESQILKAFQVFLANKPEILDLEERIAIDPVVHEWDDYFRIDVGRYLGDIELIRSLKNQSVETLVDLFPGWRISTTTFDQNVKLEMQEAAKSYMESYFKYIVRIASGDVNALFDSPITSQVVQLLLFCFSKEIPQDQQWRKISDFFISPHFSEIPHLWISARIFAVLKKKLKQGAYTNRDLSHIATYAPYCDAFVMDNAMASIVADPDIHLESRYGTKIFSLNNWEQLFIWLDDLEASMSQEHREGLIAAYPSTSL